MHLIGQGWKGEIWSLARGHNTGSSSMPKRTISTALDSVDKKTEEMKVMCMYVDCTSRSWPFMQGL